MNVTQVFFISSCQRIKISSKEPYLCKMFGFQDLSVVVVDEPVNNVDKMPEIVEHPATPQFEKDEGNDDIVPVKSPDDIKKEESEFLLIFNLFSKYVFIKFYNLPIHYILLSQGLLYLKKSMVYFSMNTVKSRVLTHLV